MTPSTSSDTLHPHQAVGAMETSWLKALVILQKWAGALEESLEKAVPQHLFFLRVPTGKDCAGNNLWEEGKINIY